MNHWSLTFPTLIDYRAYDATTVKIDLISASSAVTVNAKLDCGSKFCVFQPHFARLLGFELESGVPQRIATAAGSFPAYGHEVTLAVSGLEWQTTVFFAEPEDFPINVVGRTGFLNYLQVGLVDYAQLLYLGPYEAV